jgi:hypothetical protein
MGTERDEISKRQKVVDALGMRPAAPADTMTAQGGTGE